MRVYVELHPQERAAKSYGYELWVHDLATKRINKWESDDEYASEDEAVKSGGEVARSFLEDRLDLLPEIYTLEIKN
jgi:hypothetical protein